MPVIRLLERKLSAFSFAQVLRIGLKNAEHGTGSWVLLPMDVISKSLPMVRLPPKTSASGRPIYTYGHQYDDAWVVHVARPVEGADFSECLATTRHWDTFCCVCVPNVSVSAEPLAPPPLPVHARRRLQGIRHRRREIAGRRRGAR